MSVNYGRNKVFATFAVCVAAAFVAGLIDSIAGGGGLITMPALLLMNVPPHLTLGTNKFASSLGTLASMLTYARKGFVVWRMTGPGVAAALAGSYMGSRYALSMDSALLGKTMVFLLPLGMLATLLPKPPVLPEHLPSVPLGPLRLWVLVPLGCFAIGAYDGFFGPGTGSFLILAFHLVLGLGLIQASATAKVLNLASNVGALTAFVLGGSVWFALAVPMALANIAGNVVGSRLAIRLGAALVRRFLVLSLGLLLISLAAK